MENDECQCHRDTVMVSSQSSFKKFRQIAALLYHKKSTMSKVSRNPPVDSVLTLKIFIKILRSRMAIDLIC